MRKDIAMIFGLLPMPLLLLFALFSYLMGALDAANKVSAIICLLKFGTLLLGTAGLVLLFIDDQRVLVVQKVFLLIFVMGSIAFINDISSFRQPYTYLIVSPLLVAVVSIFRPPNQSLKGAP